eukprot:gene6040-8316_t
MKSTKFVNGANQEYDNSIKNTAFSAITAKAGLCTLGYIARNDCLLLIEGKLHLRNVDNDNRVTVDAKKLNSSSEEDEDGFSPPSKSPPPVTRKAPIHRVKHFPVINRGYYARVESVNQFIDLFLSTTASLSLAIDRQIIIIGAGFDPLACNIDSFGHNNLKLFEIDFPDIIAQKLSIIKENPDLFPPDSGSNGRCCVGRTSFIAGDLKSSEGIMRDLELNGFDRRVPTFVLSECVLIYLDADKSNKLCFDLIESLHNMVWLSYDMINPNDAFGKTMKRNLANAGHYTPGFIEFPSLSSQEQRFLSCNSSQAKSCSMLSFYNQRISTEEKNRISKIERLDEVEEWNLIMDHYSLTVATKRSLSEADWNCDVFIDHIP